jgi:Flp pilus assembly protein TadD
MGPPPKPTHRESLPAERLLLGLAVFILLCHLAGSYVFRSQWWGLNGLSFLPAPVAIAVVLGAIVGIGLVYKRRVPARTGGDLLKTPAAPLIFAGLFMATAWLFRIRHYFLGDGLPLVAELTKGTNFHHRQPLTYAIQQWLYQTLAGSEAGATGGAAEAAAGRIVAIGSVAAGGLFAIAAWYLGRELSRRREGKRTIVDPASAALVAVLLLVQGYSLLFFGYVENYTIVTAVYAFYLLAGIRYLNGTWPLWPAGLMVVFAAALHVSAAMIWPSFAVLVFLGVLKRRSRSAAIGFAVAAVTVLVVSWALGRLRPGYDWLASVATVGRVAVTGGEGGIYKSYLGSSAHLRDFFNEQMLIGPWGLLPLIPAVVIAVRHRQILEPLPIFLGTAALTWLAVTLTIGDTNLGYPRDWDVMAPGALFYLVAALVLLGGTEVSARLSHRFLAAAVIISLFQFIPWVAVNASESRALERVKLLPMTGGRTEVMVANWYSRKGNAAATEEWYRKAMAAYEGSHVARSGLAHLYMTQKRYPEALQLYEQAASLRPDLLTYRQSVTSMLILMGDYPGAVAALDESVKRFPNDELSWMQYAQLLAQSGRYREATHAASRVLEINPNKTAARELLDQLRSIPDSTIDTSHR